MAAVDERIVEAKFDASDFEKGVNKTVQKLDELKQALNLKDSGKNIAEFAKDTTEGVEKAGNALERLSERFTTFKGMIKQQILGGLANEVSQAFLKIEQTLLRFGRTLGSEQISAGMTKYTEILNSVRTMTAAGVGQDTAYDAVKRLGDYSDQTSYSLSQMTNGMSQLVAAGMDIDKAEKSMEGLANMCASAGVNIQSAQRAFLNFSQAYGSGKMQIKDWTSFEMLNMATEPIKKIFLEAAVQAGTLVKSVDKAGNAVYKTSNKVNKAIKANKEVTSANFRDALQYGIIDKKTMEIATAEMSFFADLDKDMSQLTDEELESFAAKAFQAAKEARSFTDVMGTLKDVIATGWATSFELIFGKLDKATEFFTWLTESNLANAIYAIGDFRNAVIAAWGSDWLEGEGGIFHARDLENGILGTGRDMLLDSLKNIDEMVGAVHTSLENMFPKNIDVGWTRNLTFAEKLGYNLAMATKQFRSTTNNMLKFFTVEKHLADENGHELNETVRVLRPEYTAILQSFAKAISNITKGLGAAIGIAGKLAGIGGKAFAKLVTVIQPALDAISGMIGKLFEPIVNLNQNTGFFSNITKAADKLMAVIEPMVKPLSKFIGFLGELGAFFIQNGIDMIATNIEIFSDALGLIFDLFSGRKGKKAEDGVTLIDRWNNGLKKFADTCRQGLGAVKSFFDALFKDIRTMFGLGEEAEDRKGGAFKAIKDFFDTNTFVKNAKNFIKSLPSRISTTAKNVWNAMDEFLFGVKIKGKSKTIRLKSGFSQWLDDTVNSVKDWFSNAPQNLKELWNSITRKIFGEDIVETVTGPDGKKTQVIKSGFSRWMDNVVATVKGWISTIKGKVSDLWDKIVEFIFGKDIPIKDPVTNEDTGATEHIKSGLVKWLGDVKGKVSTWFDESGIKDTLSEIWDSVVTFFFGKDVPIKDPETNQDTGATQHIKSGFSTWLGNLKNDVSSWFEEQAISDKLSDVWNSVVDLIFGKEVEVKDPETQENTGATMRVKEGFSLWLSNVAKSVTGWIKEAPIKISDIWNDVFDAIFGSNNGKKDAKDFDQKYFDQLMLDDPTGYAATQYKRSFNDKSFIDIAREKLEGLGINIGEIFSNLPTYVAKGINNKIDLFKNLLEHAKGWFDKKSGEELLNTPAEELAADAKKQGADSPIFDALLSIGQNIAGLVTTTIPGVLTSAFTFISDQSGNLSKAISSIFDSKGITWGDIEGKIQEIGTTVARYIEQIPSIINTAVYGIQRLFRGESPLERARREIEAQFTDQNGNIIDPKAMEYALKMAEDTLSDKAEDTGLTKAIKEIAGSIKNAFIELGPDILDGFNTALQWVGDKLGTFTQLMNDRDKNQGFFEWIGSLVGGEDAEQSDLAQGIQTLGQTIKNLITTTIPAFVQAAFEEIITGFPKMLEGLFGGISGEIEAEQQSLLQSFMPKGETGVGTDTSKQTRAWSILDLFISSASAEDAVENIEESLDEYGQVLNDLDSTVQHETQLIDKQFKINEVKRKLSEEYGKQTDAYNLGDSKALIEATNNIENYEKQLKILSEAEGDMIDPAILDEAKVTEKTTHTFLESMKNIFGTILNLGSNANLVGTIGIITSIAIALHELVEMFSITDEVEAFGYTAKWNAIKIAIMGVVAMLGWISYLSSAAATDPSDKRLETTMETLDKMITFVERLGTVMTVLSALSLGKGVAEIFSGKNSSVESTGNWFTNMLGSVVTKLAEIGMFTVGTDMLSGSLESLFSSITSIFDDLGQGIESFVSFIDPAISGLAQMSDKLNDAINAVGQIAELIGAFYDMIGVVGISVAEADEGTKAFMAAAEMTESDQPRSAVFLADELERRMTFVFQLTTMMKNMANGLKSFEGIQNVQAQMKKALEVVQPGGDFVQFAKYAVNGIYNALTSTFGGSMVNLDSAAIGFEMLANAFTVFNDGINGLNLEEVGAFEQSIKVLDSLAATLEEASGNGANWHKILFGDNSLSKYGKEIKMFGGYIKGFFTSISSLAGTTTGEDDMNATQQRINMVLQVAESMATATSLLGAYGGIESLDSFGARLESFGSHIGSFISLINSNITEGIDNAKVEMITTSINAVAELMKGVGSLGQGFGFNAEEIPDFITQFAKGITENFVGNNNFFSDGSAAAQNLDAGLAAGFSTATAGIAAAQALADAITGVFTGLWVIHSPSKLFAYYGKCLDMGLKQGLDKNSDAPVKSAEAMGQSINEAFFTITGAQNSRQLRDGIHNVGVTIRQATDDETKQIKKNMNQKNIWTTLKNDPFGVFSMLSRTQSGFAKAVEGFGDMSQAVVSVAWEGVKENKDKYLHNAESFLAGLGLDLANEYQSVITPIINEYAPNLLSSLLDSGLLGDRTDWSTGDYVGAVCDVLSGLLTDVSSYMDSDAMNVATTLLTTILGGIKDQSKGLEGSTSDILSGITWSDVFNINPTITPVVDMTNIDAAAKKINELGLNGWMPLSFDTSWLNFNANQANPANYQQPNADNSGTQGTSGGSEGGQMTVTTELNGVQVVMDSGALVGALMGEIDTRLGRLGFYAEREG